MTRAALLQNVPNRVSEIPLHALRCCIILMTVSSEWQIESR